MSIKNIQNKTVIFFIILGIFLFFFLRLYRLPERLNFYPDQGILLRMTKEVWQEKKLIAIGSILETSEINGRGVFLGSFYVYSTLILALPTGWNPCYMSILVVFIQFAGIALASIVLGKRIGKKFGLLFFLAASSFPEFVRSSNYIWNPNYGIILSFFSIFALELIFRKQKPIYFILLGLLVGLTLQLHYLYWLTLPFFAIYIFLKYKTKNLLFFLLGLTAGYSNLLIFELRNNFYNTRTIFYILRHLGSRVSTFNISEHHYAIFLPFALYFVVNFINQHKNDKFPLVGIGFVVTLFAMLISLKSALAAVRYEMLNYWGYPDQLKTVEIISSQNEEYYNVANLVYGDTREYAIRYLLEQKGQKIMSIDAYPRTNILYVVASNNPLEHNVWEVSSMQPARVERIWDINGAVKLYKIRRIKEI